MDWFAILNNKQLTALGLGGPHVFGLHTNNSLELRGETSGNVYFTPEQIVRMRIGFFETRSGRFYRTKLWTTGSDRPIELQPTRASWRGYTLVMTHFAGMLIADNKRDRVETGSSKFDALLGPILVAIPTLGALVLALFVLTNEPWWGRMIVPMIPTVIFAILAWMGAKRHWPRQVLDISQLRKQLPSVQ